ncbi:hypothetical protein DFH28DRAFT_236261 [Melampsora americana]|nr:hypothetical protein DFH28DRAFT_236261 [Melampsora americana]
MRFSIIASFVALSIGLVTSQGAHNSAPTHNTFTLVRRTTPNVVTQTNGATTPLTSIVPAVLTPPVGLRDALETVHKVNNEMKGHADELNHGFKCVYYNGLSDNYIYRQQSISSLHLTDLALVNPCEKLAACVQRKRFLFFPQEKQVPISHALQ